MSRSVKLDTESLRAAQARAQEADRVTARVERDLAFAEHGQGYGEWVEEVEKAETGNVLASDNTGNWRSILDDAIRDVNAISHCAKLGILKKSRGW